VSTSCARPRADLPVTAGMPRVGRPPAWGDPPPLFRRLLDRARSALRLARPRPPAGLPELPLALRRGELAEAYLAAERVADHRRAAASAVAAMERAIAAEDWSPADLWGHRALWHFERADMTLQAARQARRIGDLRSAAGDPATARRYYAEAIDEARDIGAEHEQGLATFGMGRALLELGDVTAGRRLAGAAVDLLDRSGAPPGELQAARTLLGTEVPVGGDTKGS
jgi:tetratricopeptide (TPR) repeat protein